MSFFECFSSSGPHISSVAPGKTVLSKTTMSFLLSKGPIILHTLNKAEKSGFFFESIGVGTVAIKILQSLRSFFDCVKKSFFFSVEITILLGLLLMLNQSLF